MNDRATRLMQLHGLWWLTAAILIVAMPAAGALQIPGDDLRVACSAATFVMAGGVLVTWRRYVRWSGFRTSSTIALSVLVVAELVVWQPIWGSVGCGERGLLLLGQHWTVAGTWCIGCALTWWWAHLMRPLEQRNSNRADGRLSMSDDAVRLVIGGSLVPLLPGLFWLIAISVGRIYSRDECAVWIAYEVCAMVAVAVWLLLWRRRVRWTPTNRRLTALLAAALLLSPATVWLPKPGRGGWQEALSVLFWTLPLYAAAGWFAGTGWIWRSRHAAVAVPDPVAATPVDDLATCPACAYSLRGLSEVRCPECGWTSTVDQLVRSTIERHQATLGV